MNDNKGSLLPNERALEYLRKQFVMSAKMQGRIGQFYQVRNYHVVGTDQHYDYEAPVDVAYHLNETPSRKLLTKYGWQTEDNEALPIILFITYWDMNNKPINIDEGAQIEISGKQSISEKDLITKKFQITEVRSDLELNQVVCKVVPVREQQKENVKVLADKRDPNLENVYLNREIYYDECEVEDDEDNRFISRN